MRARRLIPRAFVLAALAVIGCKADEPAPASGSAAPIGSPRETGSAGEVERLLPTVDGVKVLQSRSRGEGHAMAVWCFDQTDAVERVKAALAHDGWTDVRTRGKDEQLGIAANKGEARFSARVAKRDPRCAGTLVSATVMMLGKIDLELKDGEKIR